MKKFVLVIGIVSCVAVAALAYFLSQGSQDAPKTTSIQDNQVNQSSTPPGTGKYTPYSTQTLAQNQPGKRVLFFYANWCPTCIPADKDIRDNLSKIPEDLEIIRVNYNDSETDPEEEDLANKYGVTYQHTFVQIDQTGQEIQKWNGGKLNDILAKVK